MRNINLLHCRPAASYPVNMPPRELDHSTKKRLEEMLSCFPAPIDIRVVAVFIDYETVRFAKEIRSYLSKAGWPTEPIVEIAAQTIRHKGVFIRMGLQDDAVIEIVVGANG